MVIWLLPYLDMQEYNTLLELNKYSMTVHSWL